MNAPRPSLLMRAASRVLGKQAAAKEGAPTDNAAERLRLRRLTSLARAPRDVQVTDSQIAGVPVVRLSSGHGDRGTVLYVHGGGYSLGSARDVTVWGYLSSRRGPDVVSVDYRLAPEHPYPAAVDDALAVYRELVETVGADRLVVAGDSAGGGLALVLLQQARDAGLPMPAGLIPLFPWADLTMSGQTMTTNAGRDLLTRSQLHEQAAWYAGDHDRRSPGLSPLFGSFDRFPPTYLPVGEYDLLLSDAHRVAEQMGRDGVEVDLDVWPGTIHGFTSFPLPEGRRCRRRIRSFIDHHLP